MSAANDAKIKTLLSTIETKRAKLGTRPKVVLESNGLIPVKDGTVNINTINTIDRCVEVTSQLLAIKGFSEQACELLNVNVDEVSSVKLLDDYLSDLKLRASVIRWDLEKKKLNALESQLKDLRSEELKTEDILSELSSSLES